MSRTMWDAGLLLVGLHLLLIGAAVLRAGLPRRLGVLLLLAGFGYSVDALTDVLSATAWPELTTVTFVGEVAHAGCLLVQVWRDGRRTHGG